MGAGSWELEAEETNRRKKRTKKNKEVESDPPTLYTLTPDRPPTGGPLLVS